MGDTAGVIDIGPLKGSFRTTKVHSASDKNTLFHPSKDKTYSEKSDPTSEDIKSHIPANQDTLAHAALIKNFKSHSTKSINNKKDGTDSADTNLKRTISADRNSKETKLQIKISGNNQLNTTGSNHTHSYETTKLSTPGKEDTESPTSHSDPSRSGTENRWKKMDIDSTLQEVQPTTTQSSDYPRNTSEPYPHTKMKTSSQKIQITHANSSYTEETSLSGPATSSHSVTYHDYPTSADYEEGGPSYYQDYQMGERLASMPYDFSGLQFSQLSEAPSVWDPQDAFLQQVGYKLYMFIPAGVAGILLGAFLWAVAMIILRAYGVMKKGFLRFLQKRQSDDLEMGPASCAKVTKSGKSKIKILPCENMDKKTNTSESKDTSDTRDYLSGEKVLKLSPDAKSYPGGAIKDKLGTSPPSVQSSPVSFSSGIGVSERGSADERDSSDSGKEFDPFDRGGWQEVWGRGRGGRRTVSEHGNREDGDRGVYRIESLHEKCCRRNSD